MRLKTADEIRGLEFDWIASDCDGRVALFSTAGGGYAPPEFLRDTDAHDLAIDAISAEPSRTEALYAPQLRSGLKNTWLTMAERGLYAFDSDPNGGPYRSVAAPISPINVDELPEAAADVARTLKLSWLKFSELREVSARQLAKPR